MAGLRVMPAPVHIALLAVGREVVVVAVAAVHVEDRGNPVLSEPPDTCLLPIQVSLPHPAELLRAEGAALRLQHLMDRRMVPQEGVSGTLRGLVIFGAAVRARLFPEPRPRTLR